MGGCGRARQQPDENCCLVSETIAPQTQSSVTPFFCFLSAARLAYFLNRSLPLDPEIHDCNGLHTVVENQSRPSKSMKSQLRTQFVMPKIGVSRQKLD